MNALTNHRRETVLTGLWHDYANLFPMLDAAAQDALRADIETHGVREPIIMFSGRILDGRNRYMAARDLILEFPVADFEGTDAEALAFVLSTNLHRRHLTESQRASVAAKLANIGHGDTARFSQAANLPDGHTPVSQAQAADMLNVSERSLRSAKTVIEQGGPELNAAVESGAVAVSAAATISELPKDEQAAVVAEGPKAVKAKAKEIREAKATPIPDPDAPPADPVEEIPADVAAVMRKNSGLTREALLRDYAELVVQSKEGRAKDKAEIQALKEKLADFTHDDKDAVIRALQAKLLNADNAKWKATEEQAAAMRKVHALKKRVEELEGMEVSL